MSGLDRRRFFKVAAGATAGLALGGAVVGCSPAESGAAAGGATTSPASTAAAATSAAARSTPLTSSAASSAATSGTGGAPSKAAIADLRKRLHGRVLLAADPGYAAAAAPRNARYLAARPELIAQVADEADVVTAIKWAVENGVAPTIKAGGHSYAGLCTTDQLLLDVSRLNAVRINQATGTATLGGAAKNGPLFTASTGGAWMLPSGTCKQVAIGGLTLGGGIGYHSHWAGLTSDHLTSTRVVLASGEVVTASPKENADLFWACRGGAGGNFGINTSLDYQLVKVPTTKVMYFRLDWTGADAATAVLSAVDAISQSAPAELSISSMAEATPVGPAGKRGAMDVFARGLYLGTLAELTDLIKPLLAIPAQKKKVLQSLPFWDAAKIFLGDEEPEHSWGDLSRYTDKPVPQSVYAAAVDLLADSPSRTATANGTIWSLSWVGGSVMDAFKPADTAYVHRGAKTLLRPTPVWPTGQTAVGDDLISWTHDVDALLLPHTTGESYQNFPNRNIVDWQKAYYGSNLGRLVDVKKKYDPSNLFTSEQSIPLSV